MNESQFARRSAQDLPLAPVSLDPVKSRRSRQGLKRSPASLSWASDREGWRMHVDDGDPGRWDGVTLELGDIFGLGEEPRKAERVGNADQGGWPRIYRFGQDSHQGDQRRETGIPEYDAGGIIMAAAMILDISCQATQKDE